MLFSGYMFLIMMASIIPIAGQILSLVLVPAFPMAFMQACADIEQGKRIKPDLLLIGLRRPVFFPLLKLGMLYLLATVITIMMSTLVDDGLLWKVISGQTPLTMQMVQEGPLLNAMLLAMLVYTPAAMGFWYAAPLIMWQQMGVGKAVFYSFFSVWHARGAFLVYGFALICIGLLLPYIVKVLLTGILDQPQVVAIVLLPFWLMVWVVTYCSFYPTYTDVFGKPPTRD